MRLNPGDTAPEFSVQDMKGASVRLSSFTGKKTLLVFFRYAGCPFCNLALDRLLEAYPRLAAEGLRVVAFFQSGREQVERYIMKRHDVPFPVIPDSTRAVYDLYGIEESVLGALRTALHLDDFFRAWGRGYAQPPIDGDFFLVPAYFLVDKELVIRSVDYGRHFSLTLDFVDIARFLSE